VNSLFVVVGPPEKLVSEQINPVLPFQLLSLSLSLLSLSFSYPDPLEVLGGTASLFSSAYLDSHL
jgi:hypothetical protein